MIFQAKTQAKYCLLNWAPDSLRIEIDPADPFTMEWEEKLITELLDFANASRNEVGGTGKEGFDLLLNVQRSFEDVASSGVFVDSVRMVIGYLVMFLYAMVVLGKRNKVRNCNVITEPRLKCLFNR